jgi:ketosteroid isomerase-like protein
MTKEFAVADRFFRSFENGDFATLESLLAADATVWHNDGNGDQSRADNLAVLRTIHAHIDGLRFDAIRCGSCADGVFQHHILRGSLPNGEECSLAAAMFLEISDGRIHRVEEYFDPAAAAQLFSQFHQN